MDGSQDPTDRGSEAGGRGSRMIDDQRSLLEHPLLPLAFITAVVIALGLGMALMEFSGEGVRDASSPESGLTKDSKVGLVIESFIEGPTGFTALIDGKAHRTILAGDGHLTDVDEELAHRHVASGIHLIEVDCPNQSDQVTFRADTDIENQSQIRWLSGATEWAVKERNATPSTVSLNATVTCTPGETTYYKVGLQVNPPNWAKNETHLGMHYAPIHQPPGQWRGGVQITDIQNNAAEDVRIGVGFHPRERGTAHRDFHTWEIPEADANGSTEALTKTIRCSSDTDILNIVTVSESKLRNETHDTNHVRLLSIDACRTPSDCSIILVVTEAFEIKLSQEGICGLRDWPASSSQQDQGTSSGMDQAEPTRSGTAIITRWENHDWQDYWGKIWTFEEDSDRVHSEASWHMSSQRTLRDTAIAVDYECQQDSPTIYLSIDRDGAHSYWLSNDKVRLPCDGDRHELQVVIQEDGSASIFRI